MPHPDPADAIGYAIRSDASLPEAITEADLRLHALEVELQQLRTRIRHLEQAIRAADRVLQPYTGNGR